MKINNTAIITHDDSLPIGCELTSTGLILPNALTFTEWQEIGPYLHALEDKFERGLQIVRWAIGDWLQYGEHHYGEKYAQAVLEDTQLSESRLATLCWLSGKIEPSRRRENLTIKHHIIVAALPQADQDELLDETIKMNWSTRDLACRAFDRNAQNNGKSPEIARAEHALDIARDALIMIRLRKTRADLIWNKLIVPGETIKYLTKTDEYK